MAVLPLHQPEGSVKHSTRVLADQIHLEINFRRRRDAEQQTARHFKQMLSRQQSRITLKHPVDQHKRVKLQC